ncbi:oxygen-independent coproporphyrinogen III oxidase [Thiohalospira sp.]|uniref:oxygen-independent coproporphyrinogen III oxidase n=1 Tax=Thiohalospira sp. TaxID=3080549 RepID=UPI00397EE3B3
MTDVLFNEDLIRRYDTSGPRYTSYPTAVQFHEGFGEAEYRAAAEATNAGGAPLSLYVHIPFCDTVCFYCACNKVVTKDRSRAGAYLDRVERELALQGELFDGHRPVDQMHWGGGTPTFLSHGEMERLVEATARQFRLRDDDTGEYALEIDPREVGNDTLHLLRQLGFNRLSIGIQDLDPDVQKAVNRVQPDRDTFGALDTARAEGFRSVSVDLMYGLPFQDRQRFARTLDRIIAAAPDRIAVFNYAHMPHYFKPQRRIRDEDLPGPQEKLAILHETIDRLTAAGYVYIGMDHFARPDDELARAQREGTLHRNFQGYSTHATCDLVAIGATGIGQVGNTYSQNVRELDDYYAALDAGRLPVFRGLELTFDDRLRRAVITDLICHFRLDTARVSAEWGIDFDDYFAAERAALEPMAADGLVEREGAILRVREPGKLLIRNICMVFDAYLERAEGRHSKVI